MSSIATFALIRSGFKDPRIHTLQRCPWILMPHWDDGPIVEGTRINVLLNHHPRLIPVTIGVVLGRLQRYTVYVTESDHPAIPPFFAIPHMLVSPPRLLYTIYSFRHVREAIRRGILVRDLWF